jgi:hypothetical protein
VIHRNGLEPPSSYQEALFRTKEPANLNVGFSLYKNFHWFNNISQANVQAFSHLIGFQLGIIVRQKIVEWMIWPLFFVRQFYC